MHIGKMLDGVHLQKCCTFLCIARKRMVLRAFLQQTNVNLAFANKEKSLNIL